MFDERSAVSLSLYGLMSCPRCDASKVSICFGLNLKGDLILLFVMSTQSHAMTLPLPKIIFPLFA